MKILQVQGVSKGVEHGPIYFCRRSQTLIQPDKADDPRCQGERLGRAMEQTAQQLGPVSYTHLLWIRLAGQGAES